MGSKKGLPTDVQYVITDVNGQCLILYAKIAGNVWTMVNLYGSNLDSAIMFCESFRY